MIRLVGKRSDGKVLTAEMPVPLSAAPTPAIRDLLETNMYFSEIRAALDKFLDTDFIGPSQTGTELLLVVMNRKPNH